MAVYIGVHVHIYVRTMNLMFVITTMVQFTKTSPVKTKAFAVQFLLTAFIVCIVPCSACMCMCYAAQP